MTLSRIPLIFLLFHLLTVSLHAQEEEATPVNTIENQFEEIFKKSNNFEEYEVVKKTSLIQLQRNAKDSLNALKNKINELNGTIKSLQLEVADLNDSLAKTQSKLEATISEKDAISLFGIPMSKANYKSLMWIIIGILALALIFFVYRFKNSNAQERQMKTRLTETEAEYEQYRKKALEKEQKLGRQLQDERNKTTRPGQ